MERSGHGSTALKLLVAIVIISVPGAALAYFLFESKKETKTPELNQPIAQTSSQSEEDRQLIAKQKICPVSEQPLDSMGEPYRMEVEGKVVFVCCKGCTKALSKEPAKYLAKLK